MALPLRCSLPTPAPPRPRSDRACAAASAVELCQPLGRAHVGPAAGVDLCADTALVHGAAQQRGQRRLNAVRVAGRNVAPGLGEQLCTQQGDGAVGVAGAGSPGARFNASPSGDKPKSPRGLCAGLGTSHRWARRSLAAKACTAALSNTKSGANTSPAASQNTGPSWGSARAMPPAVSSAPPKSTPSWEYEIDSCSRLSIKRWRPKTSANRSLICDPSQAVLMTARCTPASCNACRCHSSSGSPCTASSGLGVLSVSGRMRSPRPAASSSAGTWVGMAGFIALMPPAPARRPAAAHGAAPKTARTRPAVHPSATVPCPNGRRRNCTRRHRA